MAGRCALLLVLVAIAGCGARTGLVDGETAAGSDDVGGDGSSDERLDDGVVVDSADGTVPDAWVDAPSPDALPDVALPPGCPYALPKAGTACDGGLACAYPGCDPTTPDRASCVDGAWRVVARACASASDRCPVAVPEGGSACALPSDTICVWDDLCVAGTLGSCVGGKWSVKRGGCGGPDVCPSTIPEEGTTCPPTKPGTGFGCTYRTACGIPFETFCVDGRWSVDALWTESCAPDPGCPSAMPAPGATCDDRRTCVYPNGCGGFDFAWCLAPRWMLSRRACPDPRCPDTPTSGTACGAIGTTCTYPNGGGCALSCRCAESGWSCIQEPCAEGAGK